MSPVRRSKQDLSRISLEVNADKEQQAKEEREKAAFQELREEQWERRVRRTCLRCTKEILRRNLECMSKKPKVRGESGALECDRLQEL